MKKPENFKKMQLGVYILAISAIMMSCAGRKRISTAGIYQAQIGQEMPAAGLDNLKGVAAEDTLFSEGEYEWRVIKMKYNKGHVFVEEDFYGSDRVSRIRVETPELKMRNGLRVGMTVEDLRKKNSQWIISPIPNFGLWDFYSREFPRIHFVVDAPEKSQEVGEEGWAGIKIADFAPESEIKIIVVF